MNKRALAVGIMTAGMSAGLAATVITPASAQGVPVGGSGNTYYLQAPGSNAGVAAQTIVFGNDNDNVYWGQLTGDDATELPLVRRGNVYFVPSGASGGTQNAFVYGNPDDEVYLGDWNGDGVDTLAVRRGNLFLIKNNNTSSGRADASFRYGEAGDQVLVGDFNGNGADSIMVRRGNEYFVSNYSPQANAGDITNAGVAEYRFFYGNSNDKVLVGDFAVRQTDSGRDASSSDGRDQLAIVRGNTYYQSSELQLAGDRDGNPETTDVFQFGNVGDTAFVTNLGNTGNVPGNDGNDNDDDGNIVTGDSLGVRR